jgi:hydroxymethylglutaryl-CoA lyase
MSGFVRITEVGPRDGLQNEKALVSVDAKVAFVNALVAAGFPEVEVTSFVSPRWVPQLADAAEVMARVQRRAGTLLSVLVPNERGLASALEARADKVAVFVSASEGFSQRNVNATIAECLDRLRPVTRSARQAGLPVRGYVSCVVRCPFDGPVEPSAVAVVASELLAMGCTEIDLGDTIGAARREDIERLLEGCAGVVSPSEITLHLHDTRGHATACAERALHMGVRSFDGSAAGLGGCPYAPGAPGNLATESLLAAVERCGFSHGVDARAVTEAGAAMRQTLTRIQRDSAAGS